MKVNTFTTTTNNDGNLPISVISAVVTENKMRFTSLQIFQHLVIDSNMHLQMVQT